jgi:hypothetical protein
MTKLLTAMQAILLIHVPAKFRSFTIEGSSHLSNCLFFFLNSEYILKLFIRHMPQLCFVCLLEFSQTN